MVKTITASRVLASFALKFIIGTASLYYFLISDAMLGLGLLCGLAICDYLLPTEDSILMEERGLALIREIIHEEVSDLWAKHA